MDRCAYDGCEKYPTPGSEFCASCAQYPGSGTTTDDGGEQDSDKDNPPKLTAAEKRKKREQEFMREFNKAVIEAAKAGVPDKLHRDIRLGAATFADLLAGEYVPDAEARKAYRTARRVFALYKRKKVASHDG